jgi:hypothetical protein
VPKPTYRTFVVERHVAEPRAAVWTRLVALIDGGLVDLPERLLSFEPPWRRVGRLDLAPLGLVEHTVALRDDGDDCHLVWAALAEIPVPAPDREPDPAIEAALARLHTAITAYADRAVGG